MQRSNIRILRATPDHSPFLARAILAASRSQLERGPFDIALGIDTEELLDLLEYMCLSDLVGNCHFSNFFVAEEAGEPVAALAAYDPGDAGVLPLGAPFADAYSALGHDEEKLPFVLGCLDMVQRCMPLHQPGAWTVEWVAVEESRRRQGLVGLLLDKAFEAGAHRSLQRTRISTYVGNEAAIKAYAKAGYRVDRECHDAQLRNLLGISGMVTMVRDLPAASAADKSRYARGPADMTAFLTCHFTEAASEAAHIGQSLMFLV
jgi:ribosomal protein S18 acetylase RimI-like enzyme